ncbi:tRNA pseudouridine synthase B [Leifsonia xyli subsp. xyli]|nr:tRNA pseudouridine(55) synthase TruB [Leifsonia xyli]ODA90808.1 tRNA pseudouridine synthase B [Leifsonia xyli subsp. xyli]
MIGSGLLLIDKPGGWTSHDVVARVRRLAGTRKVGHAGTLDPMATGLLVLGLNSSTRLLTYIVGAEKEYVGTIRLGAATTTDDIEGEILERAEPAALAAVAESSIAEGIAALTGEIEQVPSAVSAVKVDGKRAYARVRAGEEVVLPARAVTVSAFRLLSERREQDAIDLEVRVVCSSGTYIRSLARDLGARLGVGGHLAALRRTRVGGYDVRRAHELATLEPAAALIPATEAASSLFERLRLTEQQATDLAHGKRLHLAGWEGPRGEPVAAIAPSGSLVGLIEFRGKEARTLVNFPADEIA